MFEWGWQNYNDHFLRARKQWCSIKERIISTDNSDFLYEVKGRICTYELLERVFHSILGPLIPLVSCIWGFTISAYGVWDTERKRDTQTTTDISLPAVDESDPCISGRCYGTPTRFDSHLPVEFWWERNIVRTADTFRQKSHLGRDDLDLYRCSMDSCRKSADWGIDEKDNWLIPEWVSQLPEPPISRGFNSTVIPVTRLRKASWQLMRINKYKHNKARN